MPRLSGVLQSVTLHVAVVALAVAGVPFLAKPPPERVPTLTADLVEVIPETNLHEGLPGVVPETAPADEEDQESGAVLPVATAAAPPPPRPSAPRDSSAVVLPREKPEQIQPSPQVVPPPSPPQSVDRSVRTPPRKPSFLTSKANRSKEVAELGQQLQNLVAEDQRRREAEEEEKKKKKEEEQKRKNSQAIDDLINRTVQENAGQALDTVPVKNDTFGADIATLLKSHISTCWNPPLTVEGAKTLIVDIIIVLNREREVERVMIKDTLRYQTNEAFRVAARAVERAVTDCSPLPLPDDEYERWKRLELRFDPRGLI